MVPTLEKILSTSNFDYVINGGDNEGKYARNISTMIKSKDINLVSVLGNHDLKIIKERIGDEYKIIPNYYKKESTNFYNQDLSGISPTLIKWGYGVFGYHHKTRFVHSLNDFLMYYLVAETDIGDVAITFRHYPIYPNKPQDIRLLEKIKSEYPNVQTIYTLGGHTHKEFLNVETQEMVINEDIIQIVNVIFPPFTLNEHIIIGGVYNPIVLSDGSLKICERYLKNNEIYETVLGMQSNDFKTQVAKGELLAKP